jgi:hypothetical protein
VLAGGGCPRVSHKVTFDKVWLHDTGNDACLTFFFGCYPRATVPPGLDKYQIDCNGFKSPAAGGDSFVFTSDDLDKAQEHELAASCSELVSVPVRNETLMASNQSMLERADTVRCLGTGSS